MSWFRNIDIYFDDIIKVEVMMIDQISKIAQLLDVCVCVCVYVYVCVCVCVFVSLSRINRKD